MKDDSLLAFGNDPGEVNWPYTMSYDWTLFIPMSPQARHLYSVLRSMLNDGDKERMSSQTMKRLTMHDIRMLLGAGLGQVPSVSSVRRWRNELQDIGLIRMSEMGTVSSLGRGTIQSAVACSIYVRRFPMSDTKGWRSAFDLLRALESTESDELPEPPVIGRSNLTTRYDLQERENVGIDPVFEASNLKGGASNLNGGASDLTRPPVSDLREPAPKECIEEVVEESLSPLPLSGSASEESERPQEMNRSARIHEAAQKVVDGLKADFGSAREERIVGRVREAIAGGLPPSRALGFLERRVGPGVYDPARLHDTNAKDLPKPRESDRPLWLMELCESCDGGGYTGDSSMWSAAPTAIKGVCLHGEPDPWANPEQRKALEGVQTAWEAAATAAAKAAQEKRLRRQQAMLERRKSQQVKGIDCRCSNPDSMCDPCRLSENRVPDLPGESWKYQPGYRPTEGKTA